MGGVPREHSLSSLFVALARVPDEHELRGRRRFAHEPLEVVRLAPPFALLEQPLAQLGRELVRARRPLCAREKTQRDLDNAAIEHRADAPRVTIRRSHAAKPSAHRIALAKFECESELSRAGSQDGHRQRRGLTGGGELEHEPENAREDVAPCVLRVLPAERHSQKADPAARFDLSATSRVSFLLMLAFGMNHAPCRQDRQ